jgi:hypothetical protein
MERNVRKVFKIVLFILISLFAIYIGFAILSISKSSNYTARASFTVPPDYSELFNDSAMHHLVLEVTYLTKGRNPISQLTYRDNSSVLIYKVNVPPKMNLRDLLNYEIKVSNQSMTMGYTILNLPLYNLSYIWDSVPEAKHVFLTIFGDSLSNMFRNDTIDCFYLRLNKISIEFKNDKIANIIVNRKTSFSERIPMEFILIKRKTGLYFAFLTSNNENEILDKDLPNKIFRMQ